MSADQPRDPVELLRTLGAQFSPDLDAYASGRLEAHQIRCVLCRLTPCTCTDQPTADQEN